MLTAEIMDRYGLVRDWRAVGFFETEAHRQIGRAVRGGIGSGRLIAVTGPVGVGKTVFLHRLQDEIEQERKIIVARSLSVDKDRTTVPTLIAALFVNRHGTGTPDRRANGTPLPTRSRCAGVIAAEP
jgi:type II secretory pathway predicted ATPase ExeA